MEVKITTHISNIRETYQLGILLPYVVFPYFKRIHTMGFVRKFQVLHVYKFIAVQKCVLSFGFLSLNSCTFITSTWLAAVYLK
jgi:hypothetical protein